MRLFIFVASQLPVVDSVAETYTLEQVLTDWANTHGSYAYGSTGIRASESDRYATAGLRIDPRTGRQSVLETFGSGDVVCAALNTSLATHFD